MSPRNRHCVLVLATFAIAFGAASCSAQGLDFEKSSRLHDVQPTQYSTAKLPLTMSWAADPLPAGQRYLVLIDRSPMAPGESIDEVVDDTCKATKGCPDKAYLNSNYMFETRNNRLKVTSVPVAGEYDIDDLSNLHRASIVILDANDRRVGEQIWNVDFKVPTA